ncbi:unnamed protein product [Cuscuta campestris]|uniref:Secreted protein n=1 Tax=Cuscuta campestris TaxID=132261 RepID=A0A484KGZ2_9ASTE|nr:unnamed protein product [Cuscuta campestris]
MEKAFCQIHLFLLLFLRSSFTVSDQTTGKPCAVSLLKLEVDDHRQIQFAHRRSGREHTAAGADLTPITIECPN